MKYQSEQRKKKKQKKRNLALQRGLRPATGVRYKQTEDMAHSRQYTQIMNSQRWRNLRAETLRARPYCERCEAKGRLTPAKVVHHVKPIESGHSNEEYIRLAYDPENLQARRVRLLLWGLLFSEILYHRLALTNPISEISNPNP